MELILCNVNLILLTLRNILVWLYWQPFCCYNRLIEYYPAYNCCHLVEIHFPNGVIKKHICIVFFLLCLLEVSLRYKILHKFRNIWSYRSLLFLWVLMGSLAEGWFYAAHYTPNAHSHEIEVFLWKWPTVRCVLAVCLSLFTGLFTGIFLA